MARIGHAVIPAHRLLLLRLHRRLRSARLVLDVPTLRADPLHLPFPRTHSHRPRVAQIPTAVGASFSVINHKYGFLLG